MVCRSACAAEGEHTSRYIVDQRQYLRAPERWSMNFVHDTLADGRPFRILVDHGIEFQSRALEDWAYRRGIQLDVIRPGKPVEKAFIESLNGRLRDECVNVYQFTSLAEAQLSC